MLLNNVLNLSRTSSSEESQGRSDDIMCMTLLNITTRPLFSDIIQLLNLFLLIILPTAIHTLFPSTFFFDTAPTHIYLLSLHYPFFFFLNDPPPTNFSLLPLPDPLRF